MALHLHPIRLGVDSDQADFWIKVTDLARYSQNLDRMRNKFDWSLMRVDRGHTESIEKRSEWN